MDRMKAAKFGVIFFGMGLTMTRGKHANSEALLALTRDMNAYTRFVAKPNRGHGNVTGADNVVAWRTGYPFGVNHARGYPRFNPGEYTTSDTLARGEADCGDDDRLRPDGQLLAAGPRASGVDPVHRARHQGNAHHAGRRRSPSPSRPTASTRAARSTAWTTCRSRCGRPFDSPHPSDFDVLTGIEERVKTLLGITA